MCLLLSRSIKLCSSVAWRKACLTICHPGKTIIVCSCSLVDVVSCALLLNVPNYAPQLITRCRGLLKCSAGAAVVGKAPKTYVADHSTARAHPLSTSVPTSQGAHCLIIWRT